MFRSATTTMIRGVRHLSVARPANDKVGFIGLGNMGAHMARNLLKSGKTLSVFDLNQSAVDDLASSGATAAASPAEAADGATTIITMLPSSPHVEAVFTGENGIFETLGTDVLCIDSSTIDPSMSKKVCAMTEERGCDFVDAPVSGGVGGAEAGTLTFMVGGSDAAFNDANEILVHMGANIVHCGDVGTGQAAKICNNMLLAIGMIGASETMNLGVKLGMDPKLLAGILNTSTGRNWATEIYNPCPGVVDGAPAGRGYTGGFGSALMNKDVGLALDAARDAGATIPLGTLSREVYTAMCDAGYAEKDFSSAYEFLQEPNKWSK